MEYSNILNNYFILWNFPLLDEDIKKVEPNEGQNLPNTKENKTAYSSNKLKQRRKTLKNRKSSSDNITISIASIYPVKNEKSNRN